MPQSIDKRLLTLWSRRQTVLPYRSRSRLCSSSRQMLSNSHAPRQNRVTENTTTQSLLPPRSSPPIRSNASIKTTALPRITHMPNRTFSLLGLLSVASSRTIFKKTYVEMMLASARMHIRSKTIGRVFDSHRNPVVCP